jgi:hypothetical protein
MAADGQPFLARVQFLYWDRHLVYLLYEIIALWPSQQLGKFCTKRPRGIISSVFLTLGRRMKWEKKKPEVPALGVRLLSAPSWICYQQMLLMAVASSSLKWRGPFLPCRASIHNRRVMCLKFWTVVYVFYTIGTMTHLISNLTPSHPANIPSLCSSSSGLLRSECLPHCTWMENWVPVDFSGITTLSYQDHVYPKCYQGKRTCHLASSNLN